MKNKTKAINAILLFSFLSIFMSSGSAFGKTKPLSDLDNLNKPSFEKVFMQRVIDADSISRVFDAQPANDYEQFRNKLAPDAGTAVTRRYKAAPMRVGNQKKKKRKKNNTNKRRRLSDFNIFGSNKKEL